MKTQKAKLVDPSYGLEVLLGGPKALGKCFGNLCFTLLLPAADKIDNSVERARQAHENTCLAFALAWYRCDQGRYPQDLGGLVPKYVASVPDDIFSGKPLIYRLAQDGYLLYSVGVNGKDEGGLGYGDEPPGDDMAVRVPMPAPKAR